MKTTPRRPSSAPDRGSVLVVAMLMAALIAIALGSHIQLSQTNLRISNRAFYANAAMNIAESGVEHAMWSINKQVEGSGTAWQNWTISGSYAQRQFTSFAFDQNATGAVRVSVLNYHTGSAPRVLARAIITPVTGGPIEKWVEVQLQRRALFANGMVAKNSITFSGNNTAVDSYDSRLGAYNADLGGGDFNKYDRGSAGSLSVQTADFSLGNGKIFGYVAIGTSDYSGLSVGANGIVGVFGAAAGSVDYERVTTDFSADFETPAAPAPPSSYALSAINGALDLPRAGDAAASDGKYYYTTPSISLGGHVSNVLRVTAHPAAPAIATDVVLLVTGAVGTTISVGGNASIAVAAGGHKMNLYAPGNVAIAGNGVANANNPNSFMLWGTKTTADQTISISGNGQLNAVVYAPNANLAMNGGGSSGAVRGAVVANNITVVGGSSFSYDEALADLTEDSPFGIASWQEINTAADRTSRLALVNF